MVLMLRVGSLGILNVPSYSPQRIPRVSPAPRPVTRGTRPEGVECLGLIGLGLAV